jgi:hypothetical protein
VTKLWSHSAAQNPTLSPDEQEALSLRYGNSVVIVLPLSSGNFALFGADRQLKEIVDSLDDVVITNLSKDLATNLTQSQILRSQLGEPSDKALGRDLTVVRAGRDAKPTKPKSGGVVEIEL